ncbi:hypothetical protein [Dongia sp.]|uniref:hypothetical protein n=1 Tax=Dongia sp. TaxID=1977262 RepID=UPI0034A5576F
MSNFNPRFPINAKDSDGRDIVIVPMYNTYDSARIFPQDFYSLRDLMLFDHWTLVEDDFRKEVTLRFHRGESFVPVGNLILRAPKNMTVAYKDNDPLNLRTDNLNLIPSANDDVSWKSLTYAMGWSHEHRVAFGGVMFAEEPSFGLQN